MQKTINRREFLRGASAASAMLLTPPFALLRSHFRKHAIPVFTEILNRPATP